MNGTKRNILIIEDEQPLRRFLRATLESQDYRVTEANTGHEGIRLAASAPPDMVIVDLGLPDLDGLEVIKRLREWAAIPIVVLSARGQERDKVLALDGGADDYLTKPFAVGELLARVRVAMRRVATANQETGQAIFSVGGLRVDLARREITVDGRAVHLTPNEFRLLSALIKHRGKVLTHKQLLREVWGPDSTEESHYLRVYMNQLRQKLEQDPSQPVYLLTETGVGYRLASDD